MDISMAFSGNTVAHRYQHSLGHGTDHEHLHGPSGNVSTDINTASGSSPDHGHSLSLYGNTTQCFLELRNDFPHNTSTRTIAKTMLHFPPLTVGVQNLEYQFIIIEIHSAILFNSTITFDAGMKPRILPIVDQCSTTDPCP